MEEWIKITLCVSLFATFRNLRPVDSFYASFMTSPAVNFTAEQVAEDILPISSYATTSLVIIIFLITDYVRYKPIVMLDALSSIIMFVLILKPITLFKAKLSMFFLGLSSASELAYTSYMYAKIRDRDLYQKITGIVRGSNLVGMCLSSTFGQIAVSYFNIEYTKLVYVSIPGTIIAFFTTFFLPPVPSSVYFYPESPILKPKLNYNTIDNESGKPSKLVFKKKIPTPILVVLKQLYLELTVVLSNPYLLNYGLWFAFGTGVFYQVLMYKYVLYLKLNKEDPINNKLYNGGVDSLAYIMGALSSYITGFLKVDWKKASDSFLLAGSLLSCFLLCACYATSSLNLFYALYVTYVFLFYAINVVAVSETAKHLKHDNFAFIFGVAYFTSLVVSSAITYLFVQGALFWLAIDEQYLLYGLIYGLLAIWYLFKMCSHSKYIGILK